MKRLNYVEYQAQLSLLQYLFKPCTRHNIYDECSGLKIEYKIKNCPMCEKEMVNILGNKKEEVGCLSAENNQMSTPILAWK